MYKCDEDKCEYMICDGCSMKVDKEEYKKGEPKFLRFCLEHYVSRERRLHARADPDENANCKAGTL